MSVALVIQHAMSPMAYPTLQYFSTLSHKRQNFRKKKLLNIKCVFLFSVQFLSETFLILIRNTGDMIKNVRVYWSSCKVAFILVRFE